MPSFYREALVPQSRKHGAQCAYIYRTREDPRYPSHSRVPWGFAGVPPRLSRLGFWGPLSVQPQGLFESVSSFAKPKQPEVQPNRAPSTQIFAHVGVCAEWLQQHTQGIRHLLCRGVVAKSCSFLTYPVLCRTLCAETGKATLISFRLEIHGRCSLLQSELGI